MDDAPRVDGEAAVVLLSGGLDSAVAAAAWRAAGGRLALALTADYGQRAAAPERDCASRLAARWGCPWRPLPLPWLGEAAARAGCTLMPSGAAPPASGTAEAPGDRASAAAVWVPARNLVLLACAAAWAEALAAPVVLVGFNREEAETFPDNSSSFAAAATAAMVGGCRTPVRVASPTLDLDKPGLAARARQLGLARGDLWSCYLAGPQPCGRCESCVRSERAWAEAHGAPESPA